MEYKGIIVDYEYEADTLSLIQLVGFLTLTIYRASKRELPLGSSEVIIVLHKNNCYDNEIEENILKEKVDDFRGK